MSVSIETREFVDRRIGERRQLVVPLRPGMADRRVGERRLSPLEMIRLNEVVTSVNVESLMPLDWQEQVASVVADCGRLVTLPGGKVSTSLEDPGFTTVYRVAKGHDIEDHLPWLWELYQGRFRELVSQVAGQRVVIDKDKKFGANINEITLREQKDGYELHTDINPLTGLLAVTTMHEGDGGELIHVLPDGTRAETRVKAGWLYIFDGRNHPHKVNLLNPAGSAKTRITVPMDYVFPGWDAKRPGDMEAIFGNGNEDEE